MLQHETAKCKKGRDATGATSAAAKAGSVASSSGTCGGVAACGHASLPPSVQGQAASSIWSKRVHKVLHICGCDALEPVRA